MEAQKNSSSQTKPKQKTMPEEHNTQSLIPEPQYQKLHGTTQMHGSVGTTKDSSATPRIYNYLNFGKGIKHICWGNMASSPDGARKTEFSHGDVIRFVSCALHKNQFQHGSKPLAYKLKLGHGNRQQRERISRYKHGQELSEKDSSTVGNME